MKSIVKALFVFAVTLFISALLFGYEIVMDVANWFGALGLT